MKRAGKSGLTLIEMMVVIAGMSLLAFIAVPAARTLMHSFESEGGTKAMISAALASARALAAKEQRYAGIRFQTAYNRDNPDPLNPLDAPQYMVFIVHDFDKTGLANGFRAVEGLKPIRLPDSIGVMDLVYGPALGDGAVDSDTETGNLNIVRDTTAFSIIFSPAGKLMVHGVRTCRRGAADDIFNTYDEVANKTRGMFIEDNDGTAGLVEELSRRGFLLYERKTFKERGWTGYLALIAPQMIYINPYTGTIINR